MTNEKVYSSFLAQISDYIAENKMEAVSMVVDDEFNENQVLDTKVNIISRVHEDIDTEFDKGNTDINFEVDNMKTNTEVSQDIIKKIDTQFNQREKGINTEVDKEMTNTEVSQN